MFKKINLILLVMFCCKIGFAQNKSITFNPNGTKIFLYTDANFKGKLLIIDAVAYPQMDLTVQAEWNNKISSIKIPKGYSITLWDIANKDGEEVSNAAEILSSNKSTSIPDFKKFSCSFRSAKQSDADYGKKSVINFDNKTSFIEILSMK
jgi:hypothetical protein